MQQKQHLQTIQEYNKHKLAIPQTNNYNNHNKNMQNNSNVNSNIHGDNIQMRQKSRDRGIIENVEEYDGDKIGDDKGIPTHPIPSYNPINQKQTNQKQKDQTHDQIPTPISNFINKANNRYYSTHNHKNINITSIKNNKTIRNSTNININLSNNNNIKKIQRLYTETPALSSNNNNNNNNNTSNNNNTINNNNLNINNNLNTKYQNSRTILNPQKIPKALHKSIFSQTYNYTTLSNKINPPYHYITTNKNKIKKQYPKQSYSYNKQHPSHLTKQELYQENLQLKNVINELKIALNKNKIQIEMQKKKNKKYTTKLRREFKKEIYYRGMFDGNQFQGIASGQEAGNQDRYEENRDVYDEECFREDAEEIAPQYKQPSHISPESKNHKPSSNSHYTLLPPDQKNLNLHLSNKYTKSLLPNLYHPTQPQLIHTSQYLIAGIKQKYQQLQNSYKKLQQQNQKLKCTDNGKKLQQISIYCIALQQSNKKLSNTIQRYKQKLNAYQSNIIIKQQVYTSSIINQLTQKMTKIKQKNITLKSQNKKLLKQQKQFIKTITYLQSLLISKQNLLYHSTNSIKKLTQILSKIQQQLHKQKQQNNKIKQLFIKQIEEITFNFQQKYNKQKNIFQQALISKNVQIKKLEKQMAYFMMIVENWKLGQDKDKDVGQDTKKKRKISSVSGKQIPTFKIQAQRPNQSSTAIAPLTKIMQRRQLQKQYQYKVNQIASLSNRNNLSQQNHRNKQKTTQQKNSHPKTTQQRTRKVSSVKHSQNSKKLRKVTIQQINQQSQFIRYRLIGSNLSIEQICKFLDYRPINLGNSDNKDNDQANQQQYDILQHQKWKIKYINQAQLSSILIQQPLKLKPQNAVLLSRYIIQDQTITQNDLANNYVYFDFQNQIQRTIAKSILRAFIKMYSTNLLQNNNTSSITNISNINNNIHNNRYHYCQTQWHKILQKCGIRINTALISIAPKGYISKDKWNQLFKQIGIDIEQDVKQWCIGRMLINSQCLDKLKYRAIVPNANE